jgi:hypothetical protein
MERFTQRARRVLSFARQMREAGLIVKSENIR